MENSTLSEKDQRYIWHPFTQMQNAPAALVIVRGEGAELISESGTRYIDAISSWWVNLHGHSHPYIATKIAHQAHLLEQVHFAGCTHPPAIHLAERLLPKLPGSFSRIFYSDNGSTAVEVAIKIALQYWYNKDPNTSKKRILCFKGSYHGDTFGAMSVAGQNTYKRPFLSHLFPVITLDPPFIGQANEHLKRDDVAACIFEPLVMGAGGMITYPPEELDSILAQCRQRGILTIADEVATGFGRTGPLFACELLKEKPDLICLSKGLTGGFLPLGATACKEALFRGFLSDDPSHALLHGHSYTANPLACTAALASLDLLETEHCTQSRAFIAKSHRAFCEIWHKHPFLKRCIALGTLLILEYRSKTCIKALLSQIFLDNHILVRPIGNTLYIMPPYCITSNQLEKIYATIAYTLDGNPAFKNHCAS